MSLSIALTILWIALFAVLVFRETDPFWRTVWSLIAVASVTGEPVVERVVTVATTILIVAYLGLIYVRSRRSTDIGDKQTASSTYDDDDLGIGA